MNDAIADAYDIYNIKNPNNQLILPSAEIKPCKETLQHFEPCTLNGSEIVDVVNELTLCITGNHDNEFISLLKECKQALMNRDPHTRAKECYDSGHIPCKCTLCKINEMLIKYEAED